MIQPTNVQQPYPQTGGANAVSINIFNPQAYGGANPQAQIPSQDYNSLYNVPQTSLYQPQVNPQDAYYQQFMPMQNPMMHQGMYASNPGELMYNDQAMPTPVGITAPQPNVMPQSAMMQEAPQEAPEIVQPEQEQQLQQNNEAVDTDSLVNALSGADANLRADAINKIAEYVQDSPEIAQQVLTEPVQQALINVVNEDTSNLEGPSEQQVAVAQKVANGEQLTPEEDALSEQLSPRDAANKNRIFALYTLAMMLKLQKAGLDQYASAQAADGQQPINTSNLQDMKGFNDIVNVLQNPNERPEVQVAAIQALTYIADPQDVDTIGQILAACQNSADETVKAAAAEATEKLTAITQDAQQAVDPQAQQPAQDGQQAAA